MRRWGDVPGYRNWLRCQKLDAMASVMRMLFWRAATDALVVSATAGSP